MKKVIRQHPKINSAMRLQEVFNNEDTDLLLLIKSNSFRPKGTSLQKTYNYHKKSEFLRVIFSSAMYFIMQKVVAGGTFMYPEESSNAFTTFYQSKNLKENLILHSCSRGKGSTPMVVLPCNKTIEQLNKTKGPSGETFNYVSIMPDMFKEYEYLDRDCLARLVRACLVKFNYVLNGGTNTVAMYNTRMDKRKAISRLVFCNSVLFDKSGRLIQDRK